MTATFEINLVKCCFPCPKCSQHHIEMKIVEEDSEVFRPVNKANVSC